MNIAVTWLVRIAAAAAVLLILWWIAVLPRQQLSAERIAHADTKVKHAAVMAEIAEKSAETLRLTMKAEAEFRAQVAQSKVDYDQGVKDAYQRGKDTAGAIRSGAVVVREVWRDQCPQALPGSGAEPAAGNPAVSGDRAEAIGRVRGIGGEADAGYHLLYDRLVTAQGLVNACYEQPAE